MDKEKESLYQKKYRAENKDSVAKTKSLYAEKNKLKTQEYSKQWRGENADLLKIKKKEYADNNKDLIANTNKIYRDKNKEKIAKRKSESFKIKYHKLKSESDIFINDIAIKHEYSDFINNINDSRIEKGKIELSPEQTYQHIVFHSIANNGLNCFMEKIISEQSRIDILIPELKLGIELKVSSTNWGIENTHEQIERYQNDLGNDWLVIGSAPNGEYGLNSFDELMQIIEVRKNEFIKEGKI